MDLGRADDTEDVAHARIWFDFVLRADLLALYLATPAAQQSPPPRVLLRHLVAALLAPRSAPVSASTQAALLRICVALLCGPLRATAVRAVEDALDAPLQWHLVQLLGSVTPSDAVHADELQLLRNRWLLRNRLAVHDALECAAAAVAVDGWLAHRCASDCVSELVVDTSCDLAQWHVLVDARIDHAAAVLARVDGAAAVSERLVALRTLCRALLAADSSAAQRHALVEVERARLAGDADRLTQLLAVDNCEAAAVLGVDYRRALAKQLRAAPLPTHAAAAAVAADALVVLEAARGIVATGECGAGVRAQCEAALSVRDKGSAVVRERIGALLERATFAERVRAACACADAPQSLLPASPSDPILRLLLRTGDDADGVARAAIECGADAAFLARGVAERVSAGAPTSAWLSECAGASPQLAMQQWLAGGGVGAAPPLVSLDCATLERVIAECADAGSVELLRRVLDAQVPSDAAVVHFGAGVCALFPLIASAAASGAACELEDSAWRAMVAFVDAIVRSKSTRGGNAAAFSVHRLVERVRDVATLARLYGLVRGALASCVQQTAYHPVSVELVAEPLGAALRSDDAKWGAAVVLQTRKRSIHASLDAERRLLLFAQSIAGAWARRTADVDVAARLRVAAADACARVPVPEAALFHFAGAVGIATAHCTDAGANGGSFVDAVGALLNAEALERLATVLAHARNFCAAACVCQFVPQGARLAYQLLATPWRANDWKRAYLAALFDVTIGELLAKRCFVRGWQATGDDVVRLLSTPERNEHNDAANRARVRDACCRRLFALLHREYCQLAGDAPSALLDDVAGDEDGNGGVTRAAEAAAAAAAAALAAAAARLQSDGGDEQADETMQIEQ